MLRLRFRSNLIMWMQVMALGLLICVCHSHQEESGVKNETHQGDHEHHHEHGVHCGPGEEVRFGVNNLPYCFQGSLLTNYKLWLSATAAVVIVSLCGIFGVLVIPIMHQIFYQHLIQFLVALAVGSLFGDALLHLLPHALKVGLGLNHDQVEAFEKMAAWKGLFVLGSFVVFFLLERLINMAGEWKERQKRKEEEPKKVHVIRSGHKTSDKAVGERQCKHKYSSYCVTDVDIHDPSSNVAMKPTPPPASVSEDAEAEAESLVEQGQGPGQNWSAAKKTQNGDSVDTVFIRDHETVHHGHSHAHSHLHSKPDSISSVAWMVIFGDGIHNLADGLAIGVAFTESSIAGIATSIAILCHELPHEIGDFAMLLKAGMSVKQAVFYNVISSVLAFLGMVIGVILGNVESWTSWIFCATAGIFIYVALVDMVPELNSGHAHPYSANEQNHSHFMELGLQLLGMCTGIGIMFVIALYEHDLREAFDESA